MLLELVLQGATFLSSLHFWLLSTAPGFLLQVSTTHTGKDYGGFLRLAFNDLQRKKGAISPWSGGHFTVQRGPSHRLEGGHFTVDKSLDPQGSVENCRSANGGHFTALVALGAGANGWRSTINGLGHQRGPFHRISFNAVTGTEGRLGWTIRPPRALLTLRVG